MTIQNILVVDIYSLSIKCPNIKHKIVMLVEMNKILYEKAKQP